MVFGRERFIRGILDRLTGKELEAEDVTHRKALLATATAGEVINAVCAAQDLTRQELGNHVNRKRNIANYLLKSKWQHRIKRLGTC